MELGLYTFAETTLDHGTGAQIGAGQRLRDLLEEIELADQLGLDVFGVGEHHRPDFAVSTPAVVLAAAATRTKRIRLTSAVTVLSSDDPVRVYQQFTTLDHVSNGRAEIMVGRGSFIESFPLFGYDLNNYDELFSEKLELLLALRDNDRVTWSGHHRAALKNAGVFPRPDHPLPIWVAVGGTPQSVVRAAMLNLPMALAIIGGTPERFVSYVELHRETAAKAGHISPPKISINSHGWIAPDSQQAANEVYPSYSEVMGRIGRERGWPPPSRAHFDEERGPHGAILVGSPQQVIDKILYEHELFAMDRFLLQLTVGTMPHDKVMRAIELFGTQVAPAVRKAVATAPTR
jgi:probable LLM family oxidoreductase